jgi:hypothetical protein
MATRTPYEIVELTLEQLAYNGEIGKFLLLILINVLAIHSPYCFAVFLDDGWGFDSPETRIFSFIFCDNILTRLLATLPEELWQLVSELVPALDDFYKNIVWKWLADREDDFVILNYADDMKSVCFVA